MRAFKAAFKASTNIYKAVELTCLRFILRDSIYSLRLHLNHMHVCAQADI